MSEGVYKQSYEKYCHECGETIKLNAEICPKCGVRQDVLTDGATLKHCHECGEKIKANAEICPRCGVTQNTFHGKKVSMSKFDPDINWRDLDQTTLVICCALNLLTIPGLGYLVAGNKDFGIKMIIAYLIYFAICSALLLCSMGIFILAWIPIEIVLRIVCVIIIFLDKSK